MDYWQHVDYHRHLDYNAFRDAIGGRRVIGFSTRANADFWAAEFRSDDVLLFGPESRGLPPKLLQSADLSVRIPMRDAARSLNLATAAAIGLYEALRQVGWPRSDRPLPLG